MPNTTLPTTTSIKKTSKQSLIDVRKEIIGKKTVLVMVYAPVPPKTKYIVR